MYHIQTNFRRVLINYHNNYLCTHSSNSLTTISSLFQPITLAPKNAEIKKGDSIIKSQKLLNEMGIVRQASPGMYTMLPLGLRSLHKLKNLIASEMNSAGCQQLSFPFLTSAHLWKKTGRMETTGQELLSCTDRHNRQYVLSPTHEEAITELVASLPSLTYRQLPLKLYQISSKFRDEIKPRFGLLRGREFIMKDLYTFDETIEDARKTYESVSLAYDKVFQALGVPYVKVVGATGNIGGTLSHEYHFPSAIGEDELKQCTVCDFGTNIEVSNKDTCDVCGSPMKETKGIEVGHTFLLGTKYSKVLNAKFMSKRGSNDVCQMGCYGIGVSRILAASVEVLSTETEIRWPESIAPYSVCVIAPKSGSKEESALASAYYLAHQLNDSGRFSGDVILDDRSSLTVGKKLLEAKRTGYPYIVVVGKKAILDLPMFELHYNYQNVKIETTASDILSQLNHVK